MAVTRVVKKILPFFKAMQLKSLLDYGAGALRHSRFFQEHGFRVYIVETMAGLKELHVSGKVWRLDGHYDPDTIGCCSLGVDAALANFVLNIIDNPKLRQEALANIYRNLRREGYFLAEVKPGSFTGQELDYLIMPLGFVKVGEFKQEKSLAALYKKV